jgi:hypothetical protein
MGFLFKYTRVRFIGLTVAFTTFFSQLVFAQIMTDEPTLLETKVEPFYKYRKDGKPGRAITLLLKESIDKGPVTVKVVCNSITETSVFNSTDTSNQLVVLLPAGAGVHEATTAEVTLSVKGKELSKKILVPHKKQWTVFIYPHSHVDIGYTGLQEDVEKIHIRNIDVGIDLAKKTQSYPEGARFIWNPEAAWVVNAYLKKATDSQKRSFIEAVRKGWLQIDAGHSNMNTTTCSDEELLHFFRNSNEIEKLTNVPITTMVQMDVPGAAWGLVQAAVQNGVTGFISFPNYYDLRKIWEHKPFYWKGPDGKSKILFLQGFPYGIGYTIKGSKYGLARLQTYSDNYDRVSTDQPLQNFIDPLIFQETAKLENAAYPYDIFAMTWSMADNCVIDADLPEAVKQWNETYAYPKLVIAGAKEILTAYEKKYGSIIPEYSGDFTEFWTNGLGSDAAHVGMGRLGKENLVQAETLLAMSGSPRTFKAAIDSTWENILLSAEHTWGYQTPTAPLAKVIERRKASFFSDAEKQSKALLTALDDSSVTDERYSIVNTLSWDRKGIVTLAPEQSTKGDRVIELSSGQPVPSQRLSTGELIFQTNLVPALASRMYRVVKGKVSEKGGVAVSALSLTNQLLSLAIDPVSGNISSIIDHQSNYEYVANETGVNSFHYLPGVFNGKDTVGKPTTVDSVSISIKENGPLLVSLVVRSNAEGTKALEREVRLFANQTFIEIQNTFDKIGTRKKEGIHFGFHFNLPNSTSHMDAPWSVITPEVHQLKGANRNWMTFQRWINISNEDKGVTWTAIESPLVEWGELSGTILDGARQDWLWKKKLNPSSNLYSWPLNNHWDTNFPLAQSGTMRQRYAVLFHGKYDVITANRFGTEVHRPLLAIPVKKNLRDHSFVRISNPKVVLSNFKRTGDQKGLILRLRSFSDQSESVKLIWTDKTPKTIQRCTAEETPLELIGNEVIVSPFGSESLYLTF